MTRNYFDYSNIKKFPNFYNLALLLSVGYEVEEVYYNNKKIGLSAIEVRLIKENCKLGSKPIIILPVYASENVYQLTKMSASVLENTHKEVENSNYSKNIKKLFKDFYNDEKTLSINDVITGDYSIGVANLLKIANGLNDRTYQNSVQESLDSYEKKLLNFHKMMMFDRLLFLDSNKNNSKITELKDADVKELDNTTFTMLNFVKDLSLGVLQKSNKEKQTGLIK